MAMNISGGKTGILAMLVGAIGALTLLFGSYFLYQMWQEPAADPEGSAHAIPGGDAGGDESAVVIPAPETTPEMMPAPLAASAPLLPIFELVRIEADGEALFAGLAVPNSDVHLVLDGEDAAIVRADAGGNFVAMMNIGLSDKPRVMALVSVAADGGRLESETSAIIQPITPAQIAEADIGNALPTMPTISEPSSPESPANTARPAEKEPETVSVAESVAPETATITGLDSGNSGGTSGEVPNTIPTPSEPPLVIEPVPAATGDGMGTVARDPAPSDMSVASQSADPPLGDDVGTDLPSDAPIETVAEIPEVGAVEGAVETSAAPISVPIIENLPAPVSKESETPAGVAPPSVVAASADPTGNAPDVGVVVDVAAAPIISAGDSVQGLTRESMPETPDIPGAVTQAVIEEPAPPRVLLAGPEGITVLQDGGAGSSAFASVTLDSITYSAAGEVQLSGRGPGDSRVRVYLNNRPLGSAQIAEDGQWRTPLPEVESGVYTLRVDELNADGSVASRVETPFLREDPTQIAAVAAEVAESSSGADSPTVQAITVQPGSTLWSISTEKYGVGEMYVRVFNANRDVIRNPDLIYPGQVFTLPEN